MGLESAVWDNKMGKLVLNKNVLDVVALRLFKKEIPSGLKTTHQLFGF